MRLSPRTPQGLLAPVWPSRSQPAGIMRKSKQLGFCEGCERDRPAPRNRCKGWRCACCKAVARG